MTWGDSGRCSSLTPLVRHFVLQVELRVKTRWEVEDYGKEKSSTGRMIKKEKQKRKKNSKTQHLSQQIKARNRQPATGLKERHINFKLSV
jgi:hypothetical protein